MNLLRPHVDVSVQHAVTGSNVLHLAVEKRYYTMVEVLLSQGFNPDVRKLGGLTALIIASQAKASHDMAISLIRAGADIYCISDEG